MKIKNITSINYCFAMLLSLFALALPSCNTDEEEHYLRVSGDSYTFDGDGLETYKISVNATSAWSYTVEGDWVIESAKDDTSLTIGAKPNNLASERSAKITLIAGKQTQIVSLHQRQADAEGARYRAIDDFTPAVMSPGGIYVGGVIVLAQGNGSQYTPVIIEMATGKRTEHPATSAKISARAITDQGIFSVSSPSTTSSTLYKPDGTSYYPTTPDGFNPATVEAVSVSGNIMVGYAYNKATHMYSALKWTGDQVEILESPELNGWGQPQFLGVMARGCSADGSIIYGTEWDAASPVYWTADGKVHNAGTDVLRKEKGIVYDPLFDTDIEVEYYSIAGLTAFVNTMSPNGKYFAFSYNDAHIENKQLIITKYPALCNTETGETTIVFSTPEGTGLTVLNDGTLSCEALSSGFMYNMQTKTTTPSSEWIKQKYNLIVAQDMPIEKFSVDEGAALCWRPKVSMFGTTCLFAYITSPKK